MSSVIGVARFTLLLGASSEVRPKQELLPHLSKSRTAKFAVKHVKYVWHDRTPCLIIAVNILVGYLRVSRSELDHMVATSIVVHLLPQPCVSPVACMDCRKVTWSSWCNVDLDQPARCLLWSGGELRVS